MKFFTGRHILIISDKLKYADDSGLAVYWSGSTWPFLESNLVSGAFCVWKRPHASSAYWCTSGPGDSPRYQRLSATLYGASVQHQRVWEWAQWNVCDHSEGYWPGWRRKWSGALQHAGTPFRSEYTNESLSRVTWLNILNEPAFESTIIHFITTKFKIFMKVIYSCPLNTPFEFLFITY